MVRTPSCDKNGMKKGTWTPEEDKMLVAYVTRYGCWNWRQLPRFAGLKRCGKSCRLRWMNYLRPNLKRGNYTREEEETIIRLHQSMGNKWSSIAAQLPGRTDNEVKNYWHTHLKKRVDQQDSSDKELQSSEIVDSPTNHVDQQDDLDHREFQPDSSLVPQVLDTSSVFQYTISPQPSSLSDTASTTHIERNLVTESSVDHVTNNDISLEVNYLEFRDDFWTEPFVADNSFVSSDFLTSSTNIEFLSPEFDNNYPLFANGMNFLYQEQYVQVG